MEKNKEGKVASRAMSVAEVLVYGTLAIIAFDWFVIDLDGRGPDAVLGSVANK